MTNKDKLNPHGKQVVDKVVAAGESHNFIRKFRQHFQDTMQPKFLPEGWNVNHKIFRDFGEHSKFKSDYEYDSDVTEPQMSKKESSMN